MYFFLPFHWPRAHHMTANNCLQISFLLQIIFCSRVIETALLSENGRSFSQAGREWFDIFNWSQECWSNDETIIEQGWAKYVISVLQNTNVFPQHLASANNRSAHHKSLYFAQPRPIIDYYFIFCTRLKVPTWPSHPTNQRIRFNILKTNRISIEWWLVQLSISLTKTTKEFAAFWHLKLNMLKQRLQGFIINLFNAPILNFKDQGFLF